jgi:LysR family transcriptional regulator, benzoate and cis,cis-muconate-responsive activator of ben and cat genes
VELRHLRYFAAVAQLRNVTQAAKRLHVAQPALSRQIQDLEEELGVKLLERSTRGIKLTETGKFFADEAGAVLARADQALEAVRALARGETGELRVGYAPSPTTEILLRALAAFQTTAPSVRVTLLDLASDDLESALLHGRVHVSLMVKPGSRPQPGVMFEEMVRYALCLAVSRPHRFARMTRVPLRRLLGEPLAVYARTEYTEYHEMLERIFAAFEVRPEIAVECDGATSLLAAVESGRGVAIVPEVFHSLAGSRVKLRPIEPTPHPMIVGCAYTISSASTPAAQRFLTVARTTAADRSHRLPRPPFRTVRQI